MPTAQVNDIQIYYEIHGEGEPLVLIGGLANDSAAYTDRTSIAANLAQHYKVIAFDNRGVGRTDKPDIPYSIAMMAADTAGLMQAIGIKQANIIGVSMGGRIALELTLEHPEMVKKLVLVSTAARTIQTWQRRLLFATLSRIPIRGRYPQPHYAFERQREASSSYNCTTRLAELHVPTLILHGKKDKTTPYPLAEEMHNLIPDSKLITFNGGHIFLFLKQQEFVHAVLDFLGREHQTA
ncbi:MAG TPA: alpha/beta hydrolase [Ktedonobacteraceae bacterium]|nr:alpha/beta hydrolase [Ktedonobacteraceae bacterium]